MGRKGSVECRLEFLEELEVWMCFKRVKHIRLNIKPDGRIELSVPRGVPSEEALAFARTKIDWIRKTLRKVEASPSYRAERACDAEKRAWREVVSAFAPPLVERWATIMEVSPGKLAYRDMRSRWGSCQPATGRICLNTRLALYPPECLEYVVVHELCHLKERGHGPGFYALLDAYLPDWKARRAKLV